MTPDVAPDSLLARIGGEANTRRGFNWNAEDGGAPCPRGVLE